MPFAQAAAEAVLRGPQEGVAAMAAAYERRRDLAVEILRDFGIFEYAPQGAFYLLVHCGGDSLAFCDRLLEARRVAVAPGSAFGDGAREYVRVSLASDDDAIAEGLTALCRVPKGVAGQPPRREGRREGARRVAPVRIRVPQRPFTPARRT